ncbi:M66 family metalloprotease [Acinetobacter pragensis]|uniref:Glycosyl transferase n=1 Tax=Acinetobacter pragensis TaxID=1806892 RepID=A0A151Y605_9GAMM|nr:M66 family metalloprotease [Acinetobacter pragensis]KYQ73471.1 glycosyl transferase [Acinetobacter pragensis]
MKSVICFATSNLSVCVLALMLAGCGGGGSDDGSKGGTAYDPELGKYQEPAQGALEEGSLGFYDYDAVEDVRKIREDLEGDFHAMIQFGQQHVVDPNGNEANKMPRLTSEKEALLLVTPTEAMGTVSGLSAEIYLDNKLIRTIALNDPSLIPASDQSGQKGRPNVYYSKKAWSGHLNWDEVKPGLKIRLMDSQRRSGELAEEKIDFAPPGELVLNNIRIGMLSDPPISTGHYMLLEPEKAGTDYFQTIPAAEMVVAKYDDIQLDKVMVASGVIYDDVSATDGGVYSGDMRENVGKSTFSVGINLANWGVTSASMSSQSQPQLTESVIVHHSRGRYANGYSTHGLSGGNGMLTLVDSVGNEFSHEIGHHYGLGHYPGAVTTAGVTNYFWASHHADSGWGYIANRNKMRGNLIWASTSLWDASTGTANFKNLLPYSRDAMSGGYSSSTYSKYTHYTGYSTFLKIQPHFNRAVWDETSPTGYKLWDANTRKMEITQPNVPASSEIWFNSADGNYLKPKQIGVPVFTILGGYDPEQQVGLLYPAARSNWGNVFDLPAANAASASSACWLDVKLPSQNKIIALAPKRMGSNANKLHVNIAISDQPKSVDLYCQKAEEAAKLLSHIDIPAYAEAIKPAVKIGRVSGYSALRSIELPQLEEALVTQAGKAVVNLSSAEALLYDSYKNEKSLLSRAAQQQLERYETQQNTVYRLNRWMNAYSKDLLNKVAEAETALEKFMQKLSVSQEGLLNETALIQNGTNCLKSETLEDGSLNLYISGQTGCSADDSEKWIYDALGRIHNKAQLSQCLTGNGSGAKVTLERCALNQDTQVWTMDAATTSIRQSGQCLDLSSGHLSNNRGTLIRYSCTNGSNQRWTNLNTNNNLLLAYLSSSNLEMLNK